MSQLTPIAESFRQSPLRTAFVITSMPVGGAETLLVNLIRRLDLTRFEPEVICLKEPGPLGDELSREVPVHSSVGGFKWDVRVLSRLTKLMSKRSYDAVITVGSGDKMFWGRLAARLAHVPVICSALHSTGWPDGVGVLNRCLTCITDGFIAVANNHAEFLIKQEKFPRARVFMIPNGVDTDRFRPNHTMRGRLRDELHVPATTPLVGIVAAFRPEKNHRQFVEAAKEILRNHPETHFVVVGDGPLRPMIQAHIAELGIAGRFHLLGTRNDTERILAGLDIFALTSKNEANPVSILEALSSGIPVVSPDVGSVRETVLSERTGLLTIPESYEQTADAIGRLLGNPTWARELGMRGREHVRAAWGVERMVRHYEELIETLYNIKALQWGLPLSKSANSQATPQTPPSAHPTAVDGSVSPDSTVDEATLLQLSESEREAPAQTSGFVG